MSKNGWNWQWVGIAVVTVIGIFAIILGFSPEEIHLGFVTVKVNAQTVSGFITAFTVFSFLVQYYYSRIDAVYIFANKLKQSCLNPKSDWVQSIDIAFTNDDLDTGFLNNYADHFF